MGEQGSKNTGLIVAVIVIVIVVLVLLVICACCGVFGACSFLPASSGSWIITTPAP